ncbi:MULTISPECIES: hypothetical protein [Paracoccus]|uniref:Uncharacterized protein n=1 Tax=Paracoccus pacificus TaxID=1463598 RepID=A0ABW4R8S1_9RHOB|nr:hypothetical protein [Paracoccus zhejiangensis]
MAEALSRAAKSVLILNRRPRCAARPRPRRR